MLALAPPPALVPALGPLRQHLPEQGVVSVLVDVVDADVALQVVGAGVLAVALRAKGADVARRVVHEAVADHFVLALEALAALGAGAALDGAVVRPALRVDVGVRAAAGLVGNDKHKGKTAHTLRGTVC